MSDAGVPVVPVARAALDSFSTLFSRFHWISVLSALILAAAVWLWRKQYGSGHSRQSLLQFLFPSRIWLHRSALLDYRFVLVDKLVLGIVIAAASLLLVPGADEAVTQAGSEAMDEVAKELGEDIAASPHLIIGYTAALLLTEDFLRYWAHRLMHASPLLWQFHKVHHSSEVLVPFSQLRTHPVNGLVNLVRSGLAIGIVTGAFLFVYPSSLNAITILGVNAGRFLFDVMGSHLRHSHVWLSWGPALSRILISPAQHQIHHSKKRRHWDRNFGSQFALWDWMFGTLYVPRHRERLIFGISRRETERMRSVKGLYLEPFRDARRVLRANEAD